MDREEPAAVEMESSDPSSPDARRRVSSTALFRGEREIVIVHRGQEYRLRITKVGKLILTK